MKIFANRKSPLGEVGIKNTMLSKKLSCVVVVLIFSLCYILIFTQSVLAIEPQQVNFDSCTYIVRRSNWNYPKTAGIFPVSIKCGANSLTVNSFQFFNFMGSFDWFYDTEVSLLKTGFLASEPSSIIEAYNSVSDINTRGFYIISNYPTGITFGFNHNEPATQYNLIPNKKYWFVSVACAYENMYALGKNPELYTYGDLETFNDYYVYTIPKSPIIIFKNIKDTSLDVQINPQDNNGPTEINIYRKPQEGSSYTLIRTVHASDGVYTFNDQGLIGEKTYNYMVITRSAYKSSWDDYTYWNVTTTADPAVAAARAAESAANAAKIASESTVIYAQNATNAANSANNTAQQVLNKLNDLNTTLSNMATPQINRISGLNGQSCTKAGLFTVVISATGASQYRAWVDNGDPPWTDAKQITLAVPPGAHTIYCQAKNPMSPTIAESSMTVFGL